MTVYVLRELENMVWFNVGVVDELALAEKWMNESFAYGYRNFIAYELNRGFK